MTAVDRQARIRRVSEGVVATYLHEIATQLGVHVFAADDEDALLGRGEPAREP